MTRLRRERAKRQVDIATLTEAQRDVLFHGSTFAFFGPQFNSDIELLGAAWKRHGRRLLPEFIELHPGCRPFAWWACVHKQERPIVRHHDDDESLAQHDRERHFGFLHSSILIPIDGELQPWLQPQHEYLRERGLLTPAELAHDDLESEAL